jgi:hypothetical protein
MAAHARPKLSLVRRRPSPQIAKLKDRLAAASKRARGQGGQVQKERTLITAAAAGLFALAEKKGVNIPTVAGLDPAIVIGAAATLLGPRYIGGKNGQRLQAAGDGLLALAASRAVARGGVKVSGVEIGADDDDDLGVDA